jgi:hypothetical protein
MYVKLPSAKNKWKGHAKGSMKHMFKGNKLTLGNAKSGVSMKIDIDDSNLKKLQQNLQDSKHLFGIALRQGGMLALVQTKNYIRTHRSIRGSPYSSSATTVANSLTLSYTGMRGVKITSGQSLDGVRTSGGFKIAEALHTGTGAKWGKGGMKGNKYFPKDQIVYWHEYFKKGEAAGRAKAKKTTKTIKTHGKSGKKLFSVTAPAGTINLASWKSLSTSQKLAAGGTKKYKKRVAVRKGQKVGGAIPIKPAGRKTGATIGYARVAFGLEKANKNMLRGHPIVPPLKWLDQFAIRASKAIGSRLQAMLRAIHGAQKTKHGRTQLNFNLKSCYRAALADERMVETKYVRSLEQQVGPVQNNKHMAAYVQRRVRALTRAEKDARKKERRAGLRF